MAKAKATVDTQILDDGKGYCLRFARQMHQESDCCSFWSASPPMEQSPPH